MGCNLKFFLKGFKYMYIFLEKMLAIYFVGHKFKFDFPLGPTSVGADLCLHGFSHVFGAPQHADNLRLGDSRLDDRHYKSRTTGGCSCCVQTLTNPPTSPAGMASRTASTTWTPSPTLSTVAWACTALCRCYWPTMPNAHWASSGSTPPKRL